MFLLVLTELVVAESCKLKMVVPIRGQIFDVVEFVALLCPDESQCRSMLKPFTCNERVVYRTWSDEVVRYC